MCVNHAPMQSPFDIAADLDTPVSAFLKLAPLKPRFLLESVVGGTQVGRYSFVGFGEAFQLVVRDDGVELGGETRAAPASREATLALFREALARAPVLAPTVPGLPFTGGLVGCCGYDLVRRFERLPSLQQARGGEPEAIFTAPTSVLVFDHVTRRAAVLHAGSEDDRKAVERDVVMCLRGPVPDRPHPPFRSGGFGSPRASLDEAEFLDRVERTKEHIRAGDVFQLVGAVRFEGPNRLDPFQVYRALRLLNPSPYMYFLDFGGAADGLAVVGSSPEALVRLHDGVATLRPIAGTRPRGRTHDEDLANEHALLADPKEAAEHVMLVDLARNDLGRVAVPGSIRVDPYRVIERYSHVMHIVSGVTGHLRPDADPFDLFAATFPAGTVVGAPKVRAMELIEELEPVRRGFYAGTVGYFGHGGNLDQAIAIRTLVFQGDRYSWQAGAGLVADSDPAAEHREVLAKSGALLAALKLAEEGL
ncbi:MAG: anthranilate synthase component I family protein [Alphaproteobacteria bacterium]|nr:anthranilate synthase component I family protein [Alphaproteobacteria bacterium]